MAIEIKQLIIRATVTGAQPGPAPAPSTRAQTATPPAPPPAGPALQELERDALVAACVREVLRELRKRRDR